MTWLDQLRAIEALEDADLDAGLVGEMERASGGRMLTPVRFSTPTFKSYATGELQGCSKNSFPAFSVTAGACALDCDHCQAEISRSHDPGDEP